MRRVNGSKQFRYATGAGVGQPHEVPDIEIGLLTGGGDRHYAFGLAMALVAKNVKIDFIGGDEVDSPEMHNTPGLSFFNLRRNGQKRANLAHKIVRLLAYYAKLIGYAASAKPRIFHILWNNKFEFIDRTLLMWYYKMLGKKVVLTAHNVNAGVRDSTDTLLNRMGLQVQYRLADNIFVHTEKMKRELIDDFRVRETAVTIIPYGVNNAVTETAITSAQAKQRLGIKSDDRTILFFGNLAPYKGLEYLAAAFERLLGENRNYRLVVAGRVSKGSEKYVDKIGETLTRGICADRTILKIKFIPDEETELYFKAADVLVLPYTHVFQSGVMFLGYSFGLPVIASDVGSLRDDIVEGRTGFICQSQDSVDLERVIDKYFASALYEHLEERRGEIRSYVAERHSWDRVGEITRAVYSRFARDMAGGLEREVRLTSTPSG